MRDLLESFIARLWNFGWNKKAPSRAGLLLGNAVRDGQVTAHAVTIAHTKRAEHMALVGRTGTGKSTLLHSLARQDIEQGRGFICSALHSDTTPYLLGVIAEEEARLSEDLSDRLILIEPADPEFSVGLNILEQQGGRHNFVQIAEVTQILKQRCEISSFGPRTEELLRNALLLLADNSLTLLEVGSLLTKASFRAQCLRRATNQEVRSYFEARFNGVSDAMRATMTGPVLNKLTAFTADPHFRHILGQQKSTFSLIDAMDHSRWVILNLDKAAHS